MDRRTLCKNLVFTWCKSPEVFRNNRKSVNAVQLCHWKSVHSFIVMFTVMEKLFSQWDIERERAVHAPWPQQMVWCSTTPLTVQAVEKYYASHTHKCVTCVRDETKACHSNYKAVLDKTLETPGVTNKKIKNNSPEVLWKLLTFFKISLRITDVTMNCQLQCLMGPLETQVLFVGCLIF